MEAHADEIWEGVVADWMADDRSWDLERESKVEEE